MPLCKSNYETIHATFSSEITHVVSGHLQLSCFEIFCIFPILQPRHVLLQTGVLRLSNTLPGGLQSKMATYVFPTSTTPSVHMQFSTCQGVIWVQSRADKGRKITLAILIPKRLHFRAISFVDGIWSSHASWFYIYSIMHALITSTVHCVCLCDRCCCLMNTIQRWTPYRGECEEGGVGWWVWGRARSPPPPPPPPDSLQPKSGNIREKNNHFISMALFCIRTKC